MKIKSYILWMVRLIMVIIHLLISVISDVVEAIGNKSGEALSLIDAEYKKVHKTE